MAFNWAAAANVGGSLISGLFGKSGQESANRANAREAQKNRDFQERMSSSAHQRESKDLEAAGLNRILGISQSGASTPAGATAQHKNTLEAASAAAANLANLVANTSKTNAETKLIDLEGEKQEILKGPYEAFGEWWESLGQNDATPQDYQNYKNNPLVIDINKARGKAGQISDGKGGYRPVNAADKARWAKLKKGKK